MGPLSLTTPASLSPLVLVFGSSSERRSWKAASEDEAARGSRASWLGVERKKAPSPSPSKAVEMKEPSRLPEMGERRPLPSFWDERGRGVSLSATKNEPRTSGLARRSVNRKGAASCSRFCLRSVAAQELFRKRFAGRIVSLSPSSLEPQAGTFVCLSSRRESLSCIVEAQEGAAGRLHGLRPAAEAP